MSTDLITLAREVLGGDDANDDRFLDFFEARAIAQSLARAVQRVADLADELDREGNARMDDADPTRARAAYAHAARIRNALNGDKK